MVWPIQSLAFFIIWTVGSILFFPGPPFLFFVHLHLMWRSGICEFFQKSRQNRKGIFFIYIKKETKSWESPNTVFYLLYYTHKKRSILWYSSEVIYVRKACLQLWNVRISECRFLERFMFGNCFFTAVIPSHFFSFYMSSLGIGISKNLKANSGLKFALMDLWFQSFENVDLNGSR